MNSTKKSIRSLLLFLAGLSLGVLLTAIVYNVYLTPEDCRGDSLCESGQTLIGGIFWGVLMISYLLPPIVVVVVLVFCVVKFVIPWLKNHLLKH